MIWGVINTIGQLRMRSRRHMPAFLFTKKVYYAPCQEQMENTYNITKHTHPSKSAFDLSHSGSWLSLLNSSKVWHCTVLCFFLEWVNCTGRGWLILLLRAADGQWDAQRSSQCERLPFRSSFLNGTGHTSHNTLVQPSAARRLEPTKHIGCFCVLCLKKP